MREEKSSKGLLVLAAHGAGNESEANKRTQALARWVGERRKDLRVVCAFNLGTPTFAEVLDLHEAQESRAVCVVLPLMTSDGYFVKERLAGELAKNGVARSVDIKILGPVGLREEVTRTLIERTRVAMREARLTPDQTTIVVVGHGTRRSAASGASTDALALEIGKAIPAALSVSAFLDQDPLLEDLSATLTRRADAHPSNPLERPNLLIVPFLLGGGGHALSDVPERLGVPGAVADGIGVTLREDGRGVVILPALAELEEFPHAVLSAIDAEIPRPIVRVGTRGSPLAIWQCERAEEAIARAGAVPQRVILSTLGDSDHSRSIESFASDGPFTDDIERALLEGTIDVAVHSLKDLPLEESSDTRIAAVLRRWSPMEALVARDGHTLDTLAIGALVGTCSQRRSAQLRRIRPDLRTAPIRGTIEQRLQRVASGEFDATIIALAGLARLDLEDRATQVLPIDVCVPEPGQGAVVLQVRSEDATLIELLRGEDHAASRRAVTAERAFARFVGEMTDLIPAAYARDRGGIHFIGRAISRDGRECVDVRGVGSDPTAVAREAADAVVARRVRTERSEGVLA